MVKSEYAYDGIDRLTQADYLKGDLTENEVYTMDDLGNRTEVNLRNGSDETYIVNDDNNRYTSIGGNDLTYDNAGNLTTDKDGFVEQERVFRHLYVYARTRESLLIRKKTG